MSSNTNNTYLIAGAIVIAGLLIAVGVFVSRGISSDRTGESNRETETDEVAVNPITKDDYIVGNLGAPIIIVEFSDTECPFCKSFHEVLNNVMDTYLESGEVAWVYRHFPLASIHPKAPMEAHATECAAEIGGNDGFWAYINRLYEVTPSNNGLDLDLLPEIATTVGLDRATFLECQESGRYNDKIGDSFQEAINAGGTGTPFSVFVLDKAMKSDVLSTMQVVQTQFRPGSLVISTDNKRIGLSGGLSAEAIGVLVEIIMGRGDQLEG